MPGEPSNLSAFRPLSSCPYCDSTPVDWKIESPNLYEREFRCDLRCPECKGRIELDAKPQLVRQFNQNGHGSQTARVDSCRPNPMAELRNIPTWMKVTITIHVAIACLTICYGNLASLLFRSQLLGAVTIGIWLSQVSLLILAAVFSPRLTYLAVGTLFLMLLLVYSMAETDFRYSAYTCLIVACALAAIAQAMRLWDFSYQKQTEVSNEAEHFSIRTIMIVVAVVAAVLAITRVVSPMHTLNTAFTSISLGAIPTAILAIWARNTTNSTYRLVITVIFAFAMGLVVTVLIVDFQPEVTGILSAMYVTETILVTATLRIPQSLGYRFARAS